MNRIIILVLLTGFVGEARGQYHFKNFTVEDSDIRDTWVMSIVEDAQGEIWMSYLGDALTRFDGVKFTGYDRQAGDSTSLSSSFLTCLLIDSRNTFWVSGYGGVSILDRQKNSFVHLVKKNDRTDVLFEDSKGTIWAESLGLYAFSYSDSAYIQTAFFQHDESDETSLLNVDIADVCEDPAGNIWVATIDGLNKLDASGKSFIRYPSQPFFMATIESFYIDSRGTFWIGTYGNGIWQFDQQTGVYTEYTLRLPASDIPNSNIAKIMAFLEDSQSRFWVGTDGGGLLELNRTGNTSQLYMNDPADGGSLVNNSVMSIAEDSRGNILFGTHSGLSILNAKYDALFPVNSEFRQGEGFRDRWVNTAYQDPVDKKIWYGVESSGLDIYDPFTGTFERLSHDPRDANSLASDKSWRVRKDRDGIFWIAHWGHGYTLYDREKGTFTRLNPGNSEIIHSYHPFEMFQDSKGGYWLPSADGIDHWEPGNPRSTFYHIGACRKVYEDEIGRIWTGGHHGLSRYDRRTGKLEKLSDIEAMDFYKDSKGRLWLSTMGHGLNIYNPVSDSVLRFDTPTNTAGDFIHGIIEDNHGDFWIGAQTGIYRMDGETLKIALIARARSSANVNFKPWIRDHEGNIQFCSIYGLIIINPDEALEMSRPYPPIITDLELFNEKLEPGDSDILPEAISGMERLIFNADQNVFSIQFTSPELIYPEELHFEYMLEGFDNSWRPARENRSATFTNLDPGNYRFVVRVLNTNKVEATGFAAIDIEILPPFYATLWAYAIYIITGIAILYFIIRTILKHERFKNQIRLDEMELENVRELDQLKTQFISNISHELRTPLTLIIGPVKRMLDRSYEGDLQAGLGLMHRNGQRLLHLVNQLLDFNKLAEASTTLQASEGDIAEFTQRIYRSFEANANDRSVEYVLQSDASSVIAYCDYEKLATALTNLLSNAFKFTKDRVVLGFSHKKNNPKVDRGEGVVAISVGDNGKGIPGNEIEKIFDRFYQVDSRSTRETQGTGIGLALAREIITLHQGEIEVDSELTVGSTFTIWLPLGKTHLKESEIVEEKYIRVNQPVLPVDFPEGLQEELTAINLDSEHALPLILIVDDHADMRSYICEILGDEYRLVTAGTGKHALEIACDIIPDMIISDVMMPEMDGYEFCRRIKSDERTCHIPVILLTARIGEAGKIEGLETGADDYITKPFSPAELRTRVQNLIELRVQLIEVISKRLMHEDEKLPVSSLDQRFLSRAREIVEIYRSDSEFSTDLFAEHLAVSRSQLHRKLKGLTGHSPGEFLRNYRLSHAKKLLEAQADTVAQVAYECGFSSASHFTDSFKKHFGMLPSEVT